MEFRPSRRWGEPLFLGSARLAAYYPVSMLVEGKGLNITIISHGGSYTSDCSRAAS